MRRLLPLLFLLSTSTLFAQSFTDSIEVRLVSIDVAVVDKKGNPVGGLTAEDFIVREKGKVQTITNFAELRENRRIVLEGEPAPALEAQRPERRNIVLVIDYLRLFDKFNREAYFSGLRDFVQESVREEDRITLLEWRGGGFQTTVPFTNNTGPVIDALSRIEKDSAVRFGAPSYYNDDRSALYAAAAETLDLEREIAFDPRHATQRAYGRIKRRVASLRAIVTALSGIEGRKILVMSMHRMSMDPGVEYNYSASEFRTQPLLDALVRDANASAVTIHAFWAEGLGKSQVGADIRSIGEGRSAADDHRVATSEATAIDLVARRTGGRSAIGGVLSSQRLTEALTQLDHFYSIAWKSEEPSDGKPRKIEVSVRQKGLRVITRTSYVEKSMEQRIEDKLLATALFTPQASELRAEMRVLPATDGGARVPVEVSVPLNQLTLLPADGKHRGGVRLLGIVVDANGETGEIEQKKMPLEFPSEDIERVLTSRVTFTIELPATDKSPRAAIALVDETTGAASYLVARLSE